ncbi:MAG TPA: NADH-quinone oxidoreductase subunit A [Methanosarcinales archaeon]|nr:NADH-quinone oxidoreductase subunit A [Methanosarcinales archaeon]
MIATTPGFTTGFSILAMVLFMIVVLLGLIYEWKKGVLEWVR